MIDILSRAELDLDEIHETFFPGRDKERFLFLWTKISKFVSLPPGKLRPEDTIESLCPKSKWSSVSIEIDDLTDLVLEESNGREIPDDFKTVGAVVKFLLESG